MDLINIFLTLILMMISIVSAVISCKSFKISKKNHEYSINKDQEEIEREAMRFILEKKNKLLVNDLINNSKTDSFAVTLALSNNKDFAILSKSTQEKVCEILLNKNKDKVRDKETCIYEGK